MGNILAAYPLSIFNERSLPIDYDGKVYVWDIDKTYLSTRFSSVKGLAKIPVEFAIDKRAIPGMPEVLRGLRKGPGHKYQGVPLYFISASPPFLKSVIEKKMLFDGVEQDGIIFKDWLKTLLELKPGRLWEQLGFKLASLLTWRLKRPLASEYLFGDDTEMDPWAYSLYTDIIHGEISGGELEGALQEGGVPEEDRQFIFHLMEQMPEKRGKVEKIFIHLEHQTPPEALLPYHRKLLPVKGSYQMALALFNLGLVDAHSVAAARRAVMAKPKYAYHNAKSLLHDAIRRKLIEKGKTKLLS